MWLKCESWDVECAGGSLYRGLSRYRAERRVEMSSPIKRVPVSMPLNIQVAIDDWFELAFGIRFRESSLFCTGSIINARHYAGDHGEVRVVRPMDDFAFCWSPLVADLYEEYELAPTGESIESLMNRSEFQCHDLGEAMRSGNEVMLVGRRFEAFHVCPALVRLE